MYHIQYQNEKIPVETVPQTSLLFGHLGEPIKYNFNIFTYLILDLTYSSNMH